MSFDLNLSDDVIDQIEKFLDMNLDNLIFTTVFQDEKNVNDLLKLIQKKFNLKNFPYKIICLDISHDSGKNPAWWISAMVGGILSKRDYRHIKIPENLWWNDYESLKYCLTKYFKNNVTDLVILDWWKGQLNIVKDLNLPADVISLWKWKARTRKWKIQWEVEYFYTFDKTIPVDYNLLEDKLLIKLRNEAHRFANEYRKKLKKAGF